MEEKIISENTSRAPTSTKPHVIKAVETEGIGAKVKLTIDGVDLRVPYGTTILEAAKMANIHIPTLCHHDDLCIAGVCRVCVVEVEGQRLPPGDQGLHRPEGLLAAGPMGDEADPPGGPVDVGVHGEDVASAAEEQHHRGRLEAHALDRGQGGHRLLGGHPAERLQAQPPEALLAPPQRPLDAPGLLLVQPGHTYGRGDARCPCLEHRLERREPGLQPLVSPVAERVVGVLGKDGADEHP